jgi:uncharacterized repeat protein (TIGR01451 family)
VWGTSGSDVFAVGSDGTILHYDGTTWSPMSSGTTKGLRGVWGSSGSDVFAVGSDGTILHYDGSDWNPMSNPGGYHYAVWGSSGIDVFVVGNNGSIVHYDGTTWSAMTSGTGLELLGAWGSSYNDVFAVGGYGAILHYHALKLAQTVQPGTTILAGEPITFTLSFSNTGTVAATGVLITDVVPVEVTDPAYHSSHPITPTGSVSYTWLLGELPPGVGGVITVTGVVSSGLPPLHAFSNTVIITAAMVDGDLPHNRDSVWVSIQAAPLAVDDAYTTSRNVPLVVGVPGVLANDDDLNDDPLTAVLHSLPLTGTLVLNPNGSFIYTPALSFVGTDTFTYHATDAISDSNLATVTVLVEPRYLLYLPLVVEGR